MKGSAAQRMWIVLGLRFLMRLTTAPTKLVSKPRKIASHTGRSCGQPVEAG